MSAGYQFTKTDLDNTMGRLVVALRTDLGHIVTFNAMLNDSSVLPDATLTALGYSAGDITQIRASFTDLQKLRDISFAIATQSSTSDFWFNAKHLTGVTV